jgi:chemotaxis protein histidine kinase CheA
MNDATPGLGHNKGPEADPFVQRLEADHEDLLDLEMDLLLAGGKLPAEVTSDDDVATITKWVTTARGLFRDVETKRVEVKAPYLEREKQIDGWFGDFKARITARAKEIEQRSTAYLQAKQAREEAEARARAAAAAEERRRQEAEAQEARRREQAAREAQEAAEQALRDAAKRQAAAEVTAQAEARLREANEAAAAASAQVESADQGLRTAALSEERAERKAENPGKLGKATGGGGNARVVMVPGYRIDSVSKLLQSLGPMGSYIDIKELEAPLRRWAGIVQNLDKAKDRTEIPGVTWFEQPETKTVAARPNQSRYTSERE